MNKETILKIAENALLLDVPSWLQVSRTPSDAVTPYYRFLYILAREMPAFLSVELGSREGLGAMCLAEGNPDGLVISLDIAEQISDACRRQNVRFLKQDSRQIPWEQPELKQLIDVLFIDTEHDGRAADEYDTWKGLLRDGAVVLFDDISLNPDMVNFWNSFTVPGCEKFELPLHSSGFGCLIHKK